MTPLLQSLVLSTLLFLSLSLSLSLFLLLIFVQVDLHYHGNVSRLTDIVRQRIIFPSLASIERCLKAIVDDPQLEIVAVKNRYDPLSAADSTAGYRAVVVVFRVVTELTNTLGVAGHACELQLVHHEMAQLVTPAEHLRYLVI